MYDYSVNNPVNYKDPGGNACYFDQGDIETGWAKEGECGGRFGKNLDAKTINDVSNTGINSGKGTVNPSASFANSYGAYTVGTEQTRVPNDFKRVRNPLPNYKNAKINPRKLKGYALNPEHPVGGNKARVFQSKLGFNQSNYEKLMSQVKGNLGNYEAKLGELDQYGQRYSVDMMIYGVNGNRSLVRTAWIYRPGSSIPELTSIYIP